jgi:hypothetical protein
MNGSLLILGVTAGVCAGLMAFIITYSEYMRHSTNRSMPLRSAFEAAGFAFFVFFTLSVLVVFVLTKAYMSQQ